MRISNLTQPPILTALLTSSDTIRSASSCSEDSCQSRSLAWVHDRAAAGERSLAGSVRNANGLLGETGALVR
jgi:hypothetical protein